MKEDAFNKNIKLASRRRGHSSWVESVLCIGRVYRNSGDKRAGVE